MELQRTKEELERFAKKVIAQSRANLTRGKKNTSGRLYESLGYETNASKNSIQVTFSMEDYGVYQDKGVKGTKSNYIENRNSIFSYKQHPNPYKKGAGVVPPTRAFDKWMVKKGLDGIRNDKGQFISRSSLKFAIARSIYQKGIKASLFFTKPFERAFKDLPKEITEGFSLDVKEFLITTLKDNRK